jgi:hypothetical protein
MIWFFQVSYSHGQENSLSTFVEDGGQLVLLA